MATRGDISIEKGRTGTIEVTVTGVDDWAGKLAKLFASTTYGDATPDIELTGTIDTATGIVTFDIIFTDTSTLTEKRYYYEVVIYEADKSYVRNTNYGNLNLLETIKTDPTT